MMIKRIVKYIIPLVMLLALSRCANVGSPTGGIKDEVPPELKSSKPTANALGFKGERVRIFFDEIIVLKNLNDHFLVSPPTEKKPVVRAYGKELSVEFDDTLQSNTTYTLYFGDAVADNNEGNVMKNFSFSFSTGYEMDTMRLQGHVIDAESLDPVAGIVVGIYSNMHDSTFIKNVPLRIAKTNKEGWFSVNNVKPGKYIVRALLEADNDFKFSQPTERIAFCDSIFTTSQKTVTLMDSIFRDSIGEDKEIIPIFVELQPRDTIMYYPDSILLRAFKEDRVFQALETKERKPDNFMILAFASPIEEMPKISLFDDPGRDDWFITEIAEDSLSVNYWITDTALVSKDTLMVLMDYQVSDTLEQLVWKRDTVNMRFKHKQKSARQMRREKKEDEKSETPKVKPLKLVTTASSAVPYFDDLYIQAEAPILSYQLSGIKLYEEVNDSTFKPLKYVWNEDPNRVYRMSYKWDQDSKYRLTIDSATYTSVYGLVNDSVTYDFAINGEDKYSTIILNVFNLKGNAIVQLLDKSQAVLDSYPVDAQGGEVFFEYLSPNDYFIRLFYDANGDGFWTTGDYELKQQPEEMRFFNKKISAKAYYEMEEDWDVEALPLLEQKPLEIKAK